MKKVKKANNNILYLVMARKPCNLRYLLVFITLLMLWSSCATTNKQDFSQHKYFDGAKKKIMLAHRRTPGKLVSKRAILRKLPEQNRALIKALATLSQLDETEQAAASSMIASVSINNIPPIIQPLALLINDDTNDSKEGDECDEMITRQGDTIMIKAIEIGLHNIKYKNCDNLNGPILSIDKSHVLMVTYPNGTTTIFDNELTAHSAEQTQNETIDNYYAPQDTRSYGHSRQNSKMAPSLILGILSVIFTALVFIPLGLGPLGGILFWALGIASGILAFTIGNNAIKEAKEKKGEHKNLAQNKVGKTLGIIIAGFQAIIGLIGLALLLILLFVASALGA
ncbi:MAG TPA: hypothetical protein EYM84_10535 [Flavobacteriales bacterium]|nr:hypothetical protein [Flavobacteriales bacterium]HIN40695.1 hypothetical protein [Flavobacteriales bacterium]